MMLSTFIKKKLIKPKMNPIEEKKIKSKIFSLIEVDVVFIIVLIYLITTRK